MYYSIFYPDHLKTCIEHLSKINYKNLVEVIIQAQSRPFKKNLCQYYPICIYLLPCVWMERLISWKYRILLINVDITGIWCTVCLNVLFESNAWKEKTHSNVNFLCLVWKMTSLVIPI